MALAPVITTQRLRLVPFGDAHLTTRYVAWLNDPDVVRYTDERHRRHTAATCAAYFRSFNGTSNYLWAIELADPPRGHIGNVNAYIDSRNKLADVGILIGEKDLWGQGYGREAWSAVCDYLLNGAHLRKVTAQTLAVNRSMMSLMLAAGMEEDGRRQGQVLLDGQEIDVIYGALFRARHGSPRGARGR